ncbi:MAG: hypothetical protein ACI4AM_08360 [Muribaculaceae bacterium]
MKVTLANPIYDVVFKFLMEDMRVAKIILSALLKREVVELEVRPHEYAKDLERNLSIYRIDFAARVRQDDGTLKLVLIELQKTFLKSEVLRFRQYLGAQYVNPNNTTECHDPEAKYGLPIIAVYLLGHRVGKIEEPVLYVSHKSYNYDGEEVTVGIPDPFIESLVHDSIIVQIPLLHGQVNNKLERILSVFDQTYCDQYDPHVIKMDEQPFNDDPDMTCIMKRLLMAAADADMRQDMRVEDEYFSNITRYQNEHAKDKATIAKQSEQLKQQSEQLQQKDEQLQQKDEQLVESARAMKAHGVPIETIVAITKVPFSIVSEL